MRIKNFIEETDIRILVFAPPIIGFMILLIGISIANLLTNGHLYQPIINILLGVVFLFPCFSGYAEILKKEMPGFLGNVYKGKIAVASGVFIIVMFGIFSATAFISSVSVFLVK